MHNPFAWEHEGDLRASPETFVFKAVVRRHNALSLIKGPGHTIPGTGRLTAGRAPLSWRTEGLESGCLSRQGCGPMQGGAEAQPVPQIAPPALCRAHTKKSVSLRALPSPPPPPITLLQQVSKKNSPSPKALLERLPFPSAISKGKRPNLTLS